MAAGLIEVAVLAAGLSTSTAFDLEKVADLEGDDKGGKPLRRRGAAFEAEKLLLLLSMEELVT